MCTQLKVCYVSNKVISLIVSLVFLQFEFLFDGPGVSFGGIVCPQASQTCCDTPPLLERTFPGSTFFSAYAEVIAAVRDLRE